MPKVHADWSGSKTARSMTCPGSIALTINLPRGPSGYPANWGTACHEVCEKALRSNSYANAQLDTVIEVEGEDFVVDDEMVACADVYLGHIAKRLAEGYQILGIEVTFSLDSLQLEMDAGGTADCVLYHPKQKILEVVDLKTGKGHVVEATDNAQARFYAVGAVIEFPKVGVNLFRSTIVQPRIPHKDGVIRSEELDPLEMLDWSSELIEKISMAADGIADYAIANGNSVKLDDWTTKYLHPTEEHCAFCPAAGGCPATRKLAFEAAGAWYDDGGDVHFKSNALADNAPAVVERDLNMIPLMEEWIKGRRALAHNMALSGVQFQEWELVEKIGNRQFLGATQAEKVAAIRERVKVTDEQLFKAPELQSPAGLERALGKEVVAEKLGDIIYNPPRGDDLVRIGKKSRGRKKSKTTAEKHYQAS